jgi:hypothetical protein
MTIGIGVSCSTSKENHRSDALVMVSDTFGTSDTRSIGAYGKMFLFPEQSSTSSALAI